MLSMLAGMERRSDRELLEELYRSHRHTMLYTARQTLGSDYGAAAEDVVHGAFLKAAEKISLFYGLDCRKCRALLVIITRNKAIDHIRREKHFTRLDLEDVEEALPDREPQPEELLLSAEGCRRLKECVAALDEKYRVVLQLRVTMGCSSRQIAELLDLSVKNVDMRLYRARKILKEQLAGEEAAK